MRNKIKKAVYYIASAGVIAAPALALAQFNTPSGTNLPEGTMVGIMTSGMNWILAIVGILGVVGFAIAGILYLTSAGNDDQITKAKRAMLMAIVGVIVALIGLVVMRAVKTWLGGSTTQF